MFLSFTYPLILMTTAVFLPTTRTPTYNMWNSNYNCCDIILVRIYIYLFNQINLISTEFVCCKHTIAQML